MAERIKNHFITPSWRRAAPKAANYFILDVHLYQRAWRV